MVRSVASVCAAAFFCLGLGISLSGCKKDPKTPEYWAGELDDAKRTSQKVEVLERLRTSNNLSPAMLPLLHARLASEKAPDVKAAVAHDLGELRDPASVKPLTDAIDWTNQNSGAHQLDKEVAGALGKMKDPGAIPPLLRLLKIQENFTRIEAIQSLGMLRAKEAVEPLLTLVSSEETEPFVVKKAIQALGQIGDARAVPSLVRMLFADRKNMSFYPESSFALFQIGKPASDALVSVLKGEDRGLQSWASAHRIIEPALLSKSAQILGDLNDPRAQAPLVQRLAYSGGAKPAEKMFVRMMAANALGRMRSKEASGPLAGMVEENEPLVRAEYVRALTEIGDRDALAALTKSAGKGSWEARELSIAGVGMLGTPAETAAFEKFAKDEPLLTTEGCKGADEDGCQTPDKLAQDRLRVIQSHATPLKAASECKSDGGCWAKKLDDADVNVRRRAALELGHLGSPDFVTPLIAHLTEKDGNTRLLVIQSVGWILEKNPGAAASAQGALPGIKRQLEEERGRQDYVQVNEDLRRLAEKLQRAPAS